MTKQHFKLICLLIITLGLFACGGGGGGGGGEDNPPSDNSNWDSLVWDQDNWQ